MKLPEPVWKLGLIRHSYAVKELTADVEKELLKLPEDQREAQRTKFAVFVVHNKLKEKADQLPEDIPYDLLFI